MTGFLGLYHVPEANAGDVPAQPLSWMNMSGMTVYDIAWSIDGTWGLGVGDAGQVWELTDDSLSGDPFMAGPSGTSNAGDTWYGVAYDSIGDGFYVVGDGTGSGNNVWYYQRSAVPEFQSLNNAPGNPLNAIAVVGADYMVVGSGGRAYFWDSIGPAWRTLGGADPGDNLKDVAFNTNSGSFLAVGASSLSAGVRYHIGLADARAAANMLGGPSPAFPNPLNAVDAFPIAMGLSNFLVVGDLNTIHVLDQAGTNITRIYPSFLWGQNYLFSDVSIASTATLTSMEAVAVGYNGVLPGADAAVVKVTWNGGVNGYAAFPATDSNNLLPVGGELRALTFKPASSPSYWVVIGASLGLRYYNTESGGPITVDTLYPHIDFFDVVVDYGLPTQDSILNSKVDVWTGGKTLTLVVEGSHKGGWDDFVSHLNFFLWYDNGLTGQASVNDMVNNKLGNPVDNTFAHFRFTNVPLGADTFEAVTAGNSEIVILGGTDVGILTGPNNDDTMDHRITMEFYFNVQARATPGNIFTIDLAPGPTVDQTTPGTGAGDGGLNEAGTWDIMVELVALADGGSEARYDELGLYIYQAFEASGMPTAMGGQGPPNSDISLTVETGGRDYASFVSNHEYMFGAYIVDHFYGTQDPANTISVTDYGANGGLAGDSGLA
ncbi:MAG: hypothetical protein QCI38_07150, partial [Candidatus Thermoplasmatota archaeon]|nr:hypothetical protein [Candidatus Thermoplasmatota archaeon]